MYKLNKEFSTDGFTLSVKARPQFFDRKQAVKFPVALLENTKLALIEEISVTLGF